MDNELLSVLIVEDEPAHSEAISRGLKESCFHCEIRIVASLAEYWKEVEVKQPGLVIADLNLPDGQAIELLTGDFDTQLWPVLVTTSHGDEEMAVKAIKSGAMDYIVKSDLLFREMPRIVERTMREWRHVIKRRLAEEAMRESENRYRTLFETMAQGVVYHDRTGQIISANPAAEEILGLSREQICSRDADHPGWHIVREDGSLFTGAEHPAIVALRTGMPVRNVVMGVRQGTGESLRWILVSATPQFQPGEAEPFQVYASFTDITESKKAAEVLARQNEELKVAKEKAEESDRLKTAFLANVSHEIRTPMNGILGFAELLKSPDLTGDQQHRYIEVIDQSGRRMLNIINDIVDISRIEAGQVEMKNETVDIHRILDELLQFFKPEADNKGLLLTIAPDKQAVPVNIVTDGTKLNQVMSNLIKNALKFTQSGTISFGYTISGSSLQFTVSDTGIGIKPELIERVFERFFQAEFSNSRKYEGVGLGLAISKAYVEMLGGRIWVEPQTPTGSKFSFTIPYVKPLSEVVTEPIEITQLAPVPEFKVLVAEDDEVSFMYLEEILQQFTSNILHAWNGEEAVSLVEKIPGIDVVLMDMKMPVMDGLQATRKIKSIRPELPVIMQSAFVSDEDMARAYESGCSDYLKKPILANSIKSSVLAFTKPH